MRSLGLRVVYVYIFPILSHLFLNQLGNDISKEIIYFKGIIGFN
jgi:hypothetical protein